MRRSLLPVVLALLGCSAVADSDGSEQAEGGEPPKLESELTPGLRLLDA
jgi:hypothetical protein